MILNSTKPILLSIVIPTIGRDDVLRSTVMDLLAQDFRSWECLIITQGDRILTSEAFSGIEGPKGGIRQFHCLEPNASLARNIGLLQARGDVVLFLDDDLQITNRGFLKAHLDNFDCPEVSGVFGQVLNLDRQVRLKRHRFSYLPRVGWLYFPSNYGNRCYIPTGVSNNLSVRRHWARVVGGMDAQFERGAHREESDFCLRYTARYGNLIFEPNASVVHLGAKVGGCRTWGENRGVHPLHHVTGEWYFILKCLGNGLISWRDLPHHLLHLYLRQLWNQENRWRPSRLSKATAQSLRGLRIARAKLKVGPRYLTPVLSSVVPTAEK